MWIINAVVRAIDSVINWLRRHSRAFDHFWRARERFTEVLGGRLAAGMAYYSFFAAFALALVAYSVLGFVLANNQRAVTAVNTYLSRNLPWLNPQAIQNARGTVAVFALVGLTLTGVGYVEALRSSQRAIWRLEQQPGNYVVRRLVDFAIMIGLGLVLALSLFVTNLVSAAASHLLRMPSRQDLGPVGHGVVSGFLYWLSGLSSFTVNLLLAAGLLAAVPRLRMPARRLLPPALIVALGLTLLTTLGRTIINRTAHNPAYALVASAAGLLVFLYLFHQLLLYGAAIAATDRRGRVVDLAAGPPPARPITASPSASSSPASSSSAPPAPPKVAESDRKPEHG